MRIAVPTFNLCIRAAQSALVAKAVGHEIHLVLHLSAAHRQLNERFDSISIFESREQMVAAIGNIAPDIIHVQDRPHQIAYDVLAADWDCPVVYDVHDFASQMVPGRIQPGDEGEWWAIRRASGLVFVSEGHRRYAERTYKKLGPNVVVPSNPCEEFLPKTRAPQLAAAVWEGGLFAEHEGSPRAYIDQRDIIRRFTTTGQACVIHGAQASGDVERAYADAGAIIHAPQLYPALLSELSRYEFGWYGQAEDHDQVHDTLPNKVFEYVGAGIPVLVINAREAGKFIEEHGLGVHVRRPEDLVYAKPRLMGLKPALWERRHEFTREKWITPLWGLYESLTGKKGAPNVA